MKDKVRIIISIVISAVLLGMVISHLIRTPMPTEALDYVIWIVMVIVGIFAIYRITNLAKMLSNKDKE